MFGYLERNLKLEIAKLKRDCDQLKFDLRHSKVESRQLRNLAYKLRAEKKERCQACKDLSDKPYSVSDRPLAIPKANFCSHCGRDFRL